MTSATTAAPAVTPVHEPTYNALFVAEHLGVSRAMVYDLIKTGELRALRIGRLIRIPASALDEFLAGGATA